LFVGKGREKGRRKKVGGERFEVADIDEERHPLENCLLVRRFYFKTRLHIKK